MKINESVNIFNKKRRKCVHFIADQLINVLSVERMVATYSCTDCLHGRDLVVTT
jgi:hypothetical protein